MFAFARTFIKDEKSISTGIKLIVLVIFLRGLGWGFADPFFPMYLNQFEKSYTAIGSLMGVFQVGSLLMLIPLARLADKVKDTVLTYDGEILYLLVILAYILAGVSQSAVMLVAALFLNGIANSLLVVGAESYIRRHNRLGKAKPFGFYVAFDYLGWILGMVLGAFVIHRTGLNWMFLWVIPSIFAGLLILPRIRERGVHSFLAGVKKYFHRRQDFADLFKDAKGLGFKSIFFFVLAFFDGAIRMFSYIFIPLFALSIHLSLPSIALLTAAMYLPFIFTFFFSEVTDHLKRMNVIATGLFIGAASYLLLFFIVQEKWVIWLAAMTSVSLAIIRPAYNGAITRLTPRRMLGEVTSFNTFVERLGRILGPILTGLVADYYGLKVSFLLVALVALGLGLLSLMLHGYNYLVEAKAQPAILKAE